MWLLLFNVNFFLFMTKKNERIFLTVIFIYGVLLTLFFFTFVLKEDTLKIEEEERIQAKEEGMRNFTPCPGC